MKPGGRWSVGLITLVLYPFGAGAMAVNVFFASLIGTHIGGPVASTAVSLILGGIIAIPATYMFSKHIRHLMDKADDAIERA